ncbi:hypothetical protein ETAA8_55610 [Anatilimnocola aggregata]|uniref:GYF domain-containing protein n=1 Tax=Anatilimnocola aggregata TaxID=2528021 RepID=A0A517YJM1_9BACT|nr:DUF4339 domain-containing protein [Anatilimnocola aggregata]QDU30421.1 hypothetical protein ETAA8_55610 [Anatilimnocola aggregata]
MGIRFHCPNGHKLNVKSFLAGKKGVCPDCSAKFRIPERSEPGLDSDLEDADEHAAPAQGAHQPAAVSAAPVAVAAAIQAPVQPMPAKMPAPVAAVSVAPYATTAAAIAAPAGAIPSGVPLPSMKAGAQPVTATAPPFAMPAAPIHPAAMSAAPLAMPPPPPMTASGMGGRDAIAENPLATWFVRPPSGGQFGPARGEVMRKWLTEGRVTADSLVWREGWTDWLAATEVFPSLGKAAVAMFGAPTVATKAASPSAAIVGRKKSSGALGATILVLLAIICVILVGVLAFVLSGGTAST